MSSTIAIQDDGFVDLEMGGHTAQLDLFQEYHELQALDNQARGEAEESPPGAFEALVQGRLEAHGFAGVSRYAAGEFAKGVLRAVTDRLGKDGPAPGPTPSAG